MIATKELTAEMRRWVEASMDCGDWHHALNTFAAQSLQAGLLHKLREERGSIALAVSVGAIMLTRAYQIINANILTGEDSAPAWETSLIQHELDNPKYKRQQNA